MICHCRIIPPNVLERLSQDKRLTEAERKHFFNMAAYEAHWRKLRTVALLSSSHAAALGSMSATVAAAAAPAITVYNCANGTNLPGAPVPNPGSSTDVTAKRTFVETTGVADFYRQIFKRNSVDNLGMTLQSSIHYGVKYNNAFWNGQQMTYGDGDGNIFVDFTLGNDVIAHELTHGVTQFTARLGYSNQAGGLNESMSDVFGSMFRQWSAKQNVKQADWLIGSDIMGPGAKAHGYTCLRDMAKPGAAHCLAPQPTHFSEFKPNMDPHESSGIPNLAFYKAAVAIGGYSWEKAGQVWYQALVAYRPSPSMKMRTFANRTRRQAKLLFRADPSVFKAIDAAWIAVGL
ncbi:MAG: M4 family metallopeptidase [Rhodocyclaceae bacterium]|nr:M4 family metallopeptidase [Rhodocyclaceae bacterium]MBX3667957.1 M4 family metallopeptidase [Rhodocyclaceae bacterium]